MFNKTVEHYKVKYQNEYVNINLDGVEQKAATFGIHNLKKEFLANSIEFKDFILTIAKTSNNKVSAIAYTAAIVKLAEMYNLPCKKYVGFCMKKNSHKYEETVIDFNKRKSEGIEHPLFATHMYATVADTDYEYYDGDFDNIDHIDVIEF